MVRHVVAVSEAGNTTKTGSHCRRRVPVWQFPRKGGARGNETLTKLDKPDGARKHDVLTESKALRHGNPVFRRPVIP